MNKGWKWLLWVIAIVLSASVAYYRFPPRMAAALPPAATETSVYRSAAPAAPAPAPPPETKVIVVREPAAQTALPPLPEYIDGGSFEIREDTWTDVFSLPIKEREWQDKPGLPNNLFEMRQLLMDKYTSHFAILPDTLTPGQMEYMVDGRPERHGYCPDPDSHDPYYGTVAFMRYRATAVSGGKITVHRYWTLGKRPETTKIER